MLGVLHLACPQFLQQSLHQESFSKDPSVAVPPTAMGYFTRSSVRRGNSQPAEPVKPRKLQKKNPRSTRAETTPPGNAPVNPPVAQSLQTAWEEPARARARPTWADPVSFSTPVENTTLKTMKPIGQYPTAADYKSVGLTPPVKNAAKLKKLATAHVDIGGGNTTDTPITPVADEATPRAVDDGDDPMKMVVSMDDALDTNLATPVSEAVGAQTTNASISLIGSPVDGALDGTMSDPALTAPHTQLTVLNSETPLGGAHTPPATAVMEGLTSETEKPVNRDYIAALNALPVPTSSKYDVTQLKQVVELAISHSHSLGDDDVALSLVYYWSDIDGDDFKLSLINNIGCDDTDHSLELALKTMLRHSVEDAAVWYKAFLTRRPATLTRNNSASDSSLSSAKSVEIEQLGRTFKTADIYRDTSGPKLEEAFMNGKSNTAPLKRPKKPCRVNENSFKRRREWEADPTLDETLREKRSHFSKEAEPEAVLARHSSVRPTRTTSDVDHPSSTQSQQSEAAGAEAVGDLATSPSVSALPDSQQVLRERPTMRGKGRQRQAAKAKQPALQKTPHPCLGQARSNDWSTGYVRRKMPNSIEPPENMDNCYTCNQGGNLLCCDTCENAFHFKCVEPAVDPKNPPKGEWYCPRCGVRNSLTTVIAYGRHKKRKTEFSPPANIKEYFVGVGEAVQYDPHNPTDLKNQRYYMPVPHIPRLTKPPKTPGSTPAYNDANLLKLMDNGHVILCTKCGRSSSGDRPIIRCDYCPCRFHLDCLDPPRAAPPNPFNGWMCPNHVRPDEFVKVKMVDGRPQERRVRRPKDGLAAIDNEPAPYDDVNESTFHEAFRQQRDLLPAGDMVMDFISHVKNDTRHRESEFYGAVANVCIDMTKMMAEERLGDGPQAAKLIADLVPSIHGMIDNIKSGKVTGDEYSAASTLIGLSKGDADPVVGHNDPPGSTSSSNNESGPKADNPTVAKESPNAFVSATPALEKMTTIAASSPAIQAASVPGESASLDPRHPSPSPVRRSPRSPKPRTRTTRNSQAADPDKEIGTRSTSKPTKKKRPRAGSEVSASEDERAQKRHYTMSAPL
ncbi:hypothetical protein N7462_005038 [Penicillium macrosclerotiorum]|uniref:uncharacterized protein n=1 Tax=Penicillium macrosclerotiorum TaxID=303699 RepID=UPI0025495789|nr:uncharacterized protein N7462_005038 [Penicillium macrosclerotiorum]KAJ5690646.1 hypothetical protein N7462_005038 [Penicillium macrosclerotiorum]